MTGDSTADLKSNNSACKATETEVEQRQSTNPLKRRHDGSEPQILSGVDGLDKRQCHHAGNATISWLAGQDAHNEVAHNAYSDSIKLLEGMSVTPRVADERVEQDTRASVNNKQQCEGRSACWDSTSMDIVLKLESHSEDTENSNCCCLPPLRPQYESIWDNQESHPGYVDTELGLGSEPDDTHSRGRTPEREERRGSTDSTRYGSPTSSSSARSSLADGTRRGSRASSSCSARFMIDERMEWAHQDRTRSASRDNSFPPSPFHESSPFYADFSRTSSLAPQPRSAYECECCPMTPKAFATEDELRYFSKFRMM
jgi:hypothetical protein